MEIIEKYYRENYEKLVWYAFYRVGNRSIAAAEDAVQEAFTRAVKYYKAYDPSKPFEGWFRRILQNAIHQVKEEEQNRGVVSQEIIKEAPIAIKTRSVTLSKEIMDELKNNVSERDREILEAYFFYGLKTREIAEIVPVSHSNVRYIISKFRERIQQ